MISTVVLKYIIPRTTQRQSVQEAAILAVELSASTCELLRIQEASRSASPQGDHSFLLELTYQTLSNAPDGTASFDELFPTQTEALLALENLWTATISAQLYVFCKQDSITLS